METPHEILYRFLEKWTYDKVENMSLQEYVDIDNPNTFCYWVERETYRLGSINGVPSTKYGIFKPRKKEKIFKQLLSDGEYVWDKKYGDNPIDAFKFIQKQILSIINYVIRDDFDSIDFVPINSIFKWKIAFLYSNESFIPIYNKTALREISEELGLINAQKARCSELHRFLRSTFYGESVFKYMGELYSNYRANRQKNNPKYKNTKDLQRKGSLDTIVKQYHNELQNTLKDFLENKFAKDSVLMEKDNVDILVELDNKYILYEVKSNPLVFRCIREAIGQLLHYAHRLKCKKKVEIVVFGKNAPNHNDLIFIKYIQDCLNDIEFSYEHLESIMQKN